MRSSLAVKSQPGAHENPGEPWQGIFLEEIALQRFHPADDVFLFLSPHLDDVFLSCGGLVARLASLGARVVIATSITADVPPGTPVSWFARRNQRAWGLNGTAFAVRCTEDITAARQMGVETVHLGFLDAMYRYRPDGTPYYPKTTIDVPIADEDRATTGRAIQDALSWLSCSYAAPAQLRVFSPVCAGSHVDHLLVRESAEAVFDRRSIIYYEDQPYATRPGVSWQPGGISLELPGRSWVYTCLSLTDAEIEARIAAVACYTSQIPGLFPSNFDRLLEILAARAHLIGKPLWNLHWRLLNPRASRQRMAKLMREYIHRASGEIYWHMDSSFD